MAISGKSGYLGTMDAFHTHWGEVNTTLGVAGPLVVKLEDVTTPVNRAALLTMRTGIDDALTELQGEIVDETIARGELDEVKEQILPRAQEFGRKLRADYAGSPHLRALPANPRLDAGRELFTKPMRTVRVLWGKVNSLPSGVLTLAGPFTEDDFGDLVLALDAKWTAVEAAETMTTISLDKRDALLAPVPPLLSAYQDKVKATFAPDHPLVLSLPRIYPAGGHTPDPVPAAGTWDAAGAKGKVTWDASTDPELDHYELRYSPGAEYDQDTESVVASIPKEALREVLTLEGLSTPGSTALFRLYVVLTTGNERGSETISISRP